MKHKILMSALIAIGFSLSGVSHALSVLKPDGTRSVANVEGNKLMLLAANTERSHAPGHFASEIDTPKVGVVTSMDNKAKAKAGLIGPNSSPVKAGIIGPLDNKAKAGVIAPMNQGPGKLLPAVQPSAPGMGSSAATRRGLLMQKNKPQTQTKTNSNQ